MRSITKYLLLLTLPSATIALAADAPPHFNHVIIVFQENRTPDSLFGSNPGFETGVDLVTHNDSRITCKTGSTTTTVPLTSVPLAYCYDIEHWKSSFDTMCDLQGTTCQMDKACHIPLISNTCTTPPPNPQYRYVDNSAPNYTVQPYFDIATNYGFANYAFQTNEGPSFPAHQFIISGTSAPVPPNDQSGKDTWFVDDNPYSDAANGCIAPQTEGVPLVDPLGKDKDSNGHGGSKWCYSNGTGTYCYAPPCFHHNTLATVADGIASWRYYTPTKPAIWNAPLGSQDICVPMTDPRTGRLVCTGSDYLNNVIVGNPAQMFVNDLGAGPNGTCNLAAVTFVVPDGRWSDHASSNSGWGPSWVADIIDAVGGKDNQGNLFPVQCGYWANTVVIVTWDDWGGWFDHVPPTVIRDGTSWGSGYAYGFRVPMLVVSQNTLAGTISGKCNSDGTCTNNVPPHVHDFGSILAFIEHNFGLTDIGYGTGGHYADYYAPDVNLQKGYYALGDFFSSSTRGFTTIPAPANQNYDFFLNQAGPAVDPDDDANETD